ncbi:histidine kinase/DNA gyrase B/HSP90-like ATPase [Motilibacter peucedani]|uniref:Oxygen sensor histidine kinase NreB n=1 Tax=Motilibacter peucedani TaxID=598650 RepID=A0A420XTF7_9ACTN|nr:ATP-binding protein [Motilibacter peucedani]RKS80094.1 histidine kinase/DNA gyrase B/HSP90-like ATPase [Motilibacter peucedani]
MQQQTGAPPWRVLAEPRRAPRTPASMRRIVGTFVAGSLAVALVFLALSTWLSQRAARSESIDDARRSTDLFARIAVTPALSDGLLRGDPAALAAMDTAVDAVLTPESGVVRVKIWSRDGRVLWSDEPRLVGRTFALEADEVEALDEGRTVAEVSDLQRPENVYERSQGRLLEVYRPVRTPGGELLELEAYFPYHRVVTERSWHIWREFGLITLLALVLAQLVQLPLVARMLGQLRRSERSRDHLARRAVEASQEERRRIAGSLHDGVVQDLAGASFVLAGAIAHAEPPAPQALRPALDAVRQSIGGLRSLLVELYPPSLERAGLAAALTDAASALRSRGVRVRVEVPDDVAARVPVATEAVLFRVAQEAMRNVASHADACEVEVGVRVQRGRVELVVRDDGRGFDAGDVPREAGHVGLEVVSDVVAEAGGTVELASAPGQGTALRVGLPL